jgi:hypothetical protein
MYRLYSEWDIGETNVVFASKEAGLDWLRANPEVADMAEEGKESVDECIDDCFYQGYFSWETLEVIS